MNVAARHLQEIPVSDAMSRELVTLPVHATMSEASQLLIKAGVTGAPVVDEFDHCVGVLSDYDFMRRERPREGWCGVAMHPDDSSETTEVRDQRYWAEFGAEDLVDQFMSRAPQTVDLNLSLLDAAEYMIGSHIHRLIVIDENSRPVGIVSTFDILKAIVMPQEGSRLSTKNL
ncbi:MAG: CBS domain-containing protein [Lacipirellulaceae bacterium]